MAELVVAVDVDAPAPAVWATLVDWPAHDRWMLLTSARRTTTDGDGVGAGIEAVTGIGPLSVRDMMTVTQWQPPPHEPARCVVEHTGTVVRGSGAFEVEALGPDRARVVWSEWVRPPLGLIGEIGFVVLRPLLAAFLRVSLRRLGTLTASKVP